MLGFLTRKESERTQLSVDFPQQGERITSPQYTMRVTAPAGCRKVEVAIDQGDWKICRQTDGHWLFDWIGCANGEHEVVARVELPRGRHVNSEPHEFFVKL